MEYPLSRTPFRLLTAVAASALTTGALLLLATTAGSVPSDQPVSGDDRATAHPGNIKDGDCAAAGLSGSVVNVVSEDDGTYITITSVPEGVTLTGVVVKGGPAYNVYTGDVREDLHAPLNASGGPAGISHWFACGTGVGETTTTTTTGSSSQTTTTSSGSSSSSSSVSDTSVTTTSAVSDDDLANTGFSARVPLAVGAALLLIGGALLYATRRRAFRRTNNS
jgi:LPXTG-motif cell wall-anchored protein